MKNKGITLIAMVITVIVMIIIAGVTVSMVAGDNSVLSKGERAIYQNSITQIEECLNEFYVNNYNDMPVLSNKALSLIMYFETDRLKEAGSLYGANWIDSSARKDNIFHKNKDIYNNLGQQANESEKIFSVEYQNWTDVQFNDFEFSWQKEYEINKENKVFYLLNPKNLEKIFGNEAEVLKINSNYDKLIDVYGITADLKVFYIVNRFK